MLKLWNTIKTILSMTKEFEAMKERLSDLESMIAQSASLDDLNDLKSMVNAVKESHENLDEAVSMYRNWGSWN